MRSIAALVAVSLGVLLAAAACMQEADPDDAALSRAAEEAEAKEDELATEGPQSYGDDDSLDAMQDDCEGGELLACDLLWLSSPERSAYERVALSCGGTTEETDEFCTPYIELDDDGYAPDDSEGLQDLAAKCKDGDMTACDVLYLILPEGHELEELAFTCGGRAEEGVEVDCRSARG